MNEQLQNDIEEYDDSEMVGEIPLDLFDEEEYDEDFAEEEWKRGQIAEEFGDF